LGIEPAGSPASIEERHHLNSVAWIRLVNVLQCPNHLLAEVVVCTEVNHNRPIFHGVNLQSDLDRRGRSETKQQSRFHAPVLCPSQDSVVTFVRASKTRKIGAVIFQRAEKMNRPQTECQSTAKRFKGGRATGSLRQAKGE
jgi:hypothetical protein